MPRPTTVRILGFAFTVTEEDSKHFTGTHDGSIEYGPQVITVAADVQGDRAREVLVHEVLHGVANATDIELTEHQVTALSRGLYAVVRDNPDLVRYLTSD